MIADLLDLQNPAPFLSDSAGERLNAAENGGIMYCQIIPSAVRFIRERKKFSRRNMMEKKNQQERINELYRQLSPENRRRAAAFVDSLKEGEDNLPPAADSPA